MKASVKCNSANVARLMAEKEKERKDKENKERENKQKKEGD